MGAEAVDVLTAEVVEALAVTFEVGATEQGLKRPRGPRLGVHSQSST
jgi:hypothetical protein